MQPSTILPCIPFGSWFGIMTFFKDKITYFNIFIILRVLDSLQNAACVTLEETARQTHQNLCHHWSLTKYMLYQWYETTFGTTCIYKSLVVVYSLLVCLINVLHIADDQSWHLWALVKMSFIWIRNIESQEIIYCSHLTAGFACC